MAPYSPLCHCLIFGCLITLEIMYLLIVFLPLLGSSVAGFFGRFLESEVVPSGPNLFFLFVIYLGCCFLFKLHSHSLRTNFGVGIFLGIYSVFLIMGTFLIFFCVST